LIGGEILFFDQVDSTNRVAREHALQGKREGLVILADFQSRGRGRLGRTWESPRGVNLYLSVILRPPIPPSKAQAITIMAGVAGARALAAAAGLEARIKWPNDLFIKGKKAAGLLTEMEGEKQKTLFIIMGIGVNVNWPQEDFPPEMQDKATSLYIEAQKEFSRAAVADGLLGELEQEYTLFLKEGFSLRLKEEWNRLSLVNQKRVMIQNAHKTLEGVALGLDDDGALLVRDGEGRFQRFISGEVSLRLGD